MQNNKFYPKIAAIAEEARDVGDNNIAIVLYTLTGSMLSGDDGEFAAYCQEYAIKHRAKLKEIIKVRDN